MVMQQHHPIQFLTTVRLLRQQEQGGEEKMGKDIMIPPLRTGILR
jgi:hypothetical protein